MAYPQGHVGSGNVAQIVYAKRMVLQGTGGEKKKKNFSFFQGSFNVRSSVTYVSYVTSN